MNGRRGYASGVEPREGWRVGDDRELGRRHAQVEQPIAEGVVHGHHGAGVAASRAAPARRAASARSARLRPRKRLPKNSGIASCRSRTTGTPVRRSGSGREDEEVRQRMDLDEREAPPRRGRAPARRRSDEERQVLAQVDPGAMRPGGAGRRAGGRRPRRWSRARDRRTAEGEDLDAVTGRGERLGLAPDPRILLVVGMGEHRDAPRRGGRHGRWALHGRAERTAQAARTPRVTLRCR